MMKFITSYTCDMNIQAGMILIKPMKNHKTEICVYSIKIVNIMFTTSCPFNYWAF